MYVIKRIDQGGGYVAWDGMPSSYAQKLEAAKVFATRERAERDACENERVYRVEDLMNGREG